MNARRIAAATLTTLALATGAACAADLAPAAAPAAPTAGQNEKTVRALFAYADQNHDGQLTRAEAQGRLPFTYDDFARIDTAQRGWISFEQFVGYTKQRTSRQADEVLKLGQWH